MSTLSPPVKIYASGWVKTLTHILCRLSELWRPAFSRDPKRTPLNLKQNKFFTLFSTPTYISGPDGKYVPSYVSETRCSKVSALFLFSCFLLRQACIFLKHFVGTTFLITLSCHWLCLVNAIGDLWLGFYHLVEVLFAEKTKFLKTFRFVQIV